MANGSQSGSGNESDSVPRTRRLPGPGASSCDEDERLARDSNLDVDQSAQLRVAQVIQVECLGL